MSESANDRRSQHLDRVDVPRDLAIRAYKMAMGTDTEDVFFAAMRDQIMGSTAPKTIRLPRRMIPAAILTEMEARANRVPASGITAEPGTYLHEVCKVVASMQPGDRFTVQRGALEESIPSIFHNDVWFTPADRVLGNIIGSAWTHSFHVDDRTGDVTFRRHEETGERFYSAPDRR